jgi:SAM-dependent methyltransferase
MKSLTDYCAISAGTFHKLADRYREKFMDLTLYDESYRNFCELLRPGRARVLDAACGPGNVSRCLLAHRPDLDLLGIDLAPRMVELARAAAPSAQFAVHDCRCLADLKRRFNGSSVPLACRTSRRKRSRASLKQRLRALILTVCSISAPC